MKMVKMLRLLALLAVISYATDVFAAEAVEAAEAARRDDGSDGDNDPNAHKPDGDLSVLEQPAKVLPTLRGINIGRGNSGGNIFLDPDQIFGQKPLVVNEGNREEPVTLGSKAAANAVLKGASKAKSLEQPISPDTPPEQLPKDSAFQKKFADAQESELATIEKSLSPEVADDPAVLRQLARIRRILSDYRTATGDEKIASLGDFLTQGLDNLQKIITQGTRADAINKLVEGTTLGQIDRTDQTFLDFAANKNNLAVFGKDTRFFKFIGKDKRKDALELLFNLVGKNVVLGDDAENTSFFNAHQLVDLVDLVDAALLVLKRELNITVTDQNLGDLKKLVFKIQSANVKVCEFRFAKLAGDFLKGKSTVEVYQQAILELTDNLSASDQNKFKQAVEKFTSNFKEQIRATRAIEQYKTTMQQLERGTAVITPADVAELQRIIKQLDSLTTFLKSIGESSDSSYSRQLDALSQRATDLCDQADSINASRNFANSKQSVETLFDALSSGRTDITDDEVQQLQEAIDQLSQLEGTDFDTPELQDLLKKAKYMHKLGEEQITFRSSKQSVEILFNALSSGRTGITDDEVQQLQQAIDQLSQFKGTDFENQGLQQLLEKAEYMHDLGAQQITLRQDLQEMSEVITDPNKKFKDIVDAFNRANQKIAEAEADVEDLRKEYPGKDLDAIDQLQSYITDMQKYVDFAGLRLLLARSIERAQSEGIEFEITPNELTAAGLIVHQADPSGQLKAIKEQAIQLLNFVKVQIKLAPLLAELAADPANATALENIRALRDTLRTLNLSESVSSLIFGKIKKFLPSLVADVPVDQLDQKRVEAFLDEYGGPGKMDIATYRYFLNRIKEYTQQLKALPADARAERTVLESKIASQKTSIDALLQYVKNEADFGTEFDSFLVKNGLGFDFSAVERAFQKNLENAQNKLDQLVGSSDQKVREKAYGDLQDAGRKLEKYNALVDEGMEIFQRGKTGKISQEQCIQELTRVVDDIHYFLNKVQQPAV